MKNFLELQDIDLAVTVDITLVPDFDTVPPRVTLQINDVFDDVIMTDAVHRQLVIPILDRLTVKIVLCKSQLDHDRCGVKISSLKIDSHELMPDFCYLAKLSDNLKSIAPTNHVIDHGEWIFDINEPFYRWWHRISGHGWLLEP